ncbi:MAG: hypothetical protein GFH25_541220n125 [Chloroflexi bacterium AL-N10]|nr:hypothetical protein [Chloroflexi bacterium AL-N1]NOK70133.1 hypothetical protein [Chloroflexi bacterium AL-N10]NOK77855.1 hypothetical protein [Chloroflexi bacterium AL-N5]NOK91843.1 hypothetical protein [Chloroflexi bacterium AL-N15]
MVTEDFTPVALLVFVIRTYLGIFSLTSAIGKLRNLPQFTQGTIDYRVLPPRFARLFALCLPWVELMVAMALLLGIALPVAAAATALMLLSFIVALTINLQRGRVLDCNCHGIAGNKMISWGTVARNIWLLLLSIVLITGAPLVLTADAWWIFWQQEWYMLTAIPLTILTLLLIACCYIVTQLIEWLIDIEIRTIQLRDKTSSGYR